MQISITGRNVEITKPLKDYAEEKVKRVKKYIHTFTDIHVILTVEKFRQKAEVTVKAGGIKIHGAEETENMYSAIDKVMDKIEAQARKYKDKGLLSKNKASIKETLNDTLTPDPESDE